MLLVTNPKSPEAPPTTPVTGLLNVTVHTSGPTFVGFGCVTPTARLIDTTVGGVKSTSHVYEVGVVVVELYTAST